MTLRLLLLAPLALAACQPSVDIAEAAPGETASAEVVPAVAVSDKPVMTVYKRSTCGCCSMWIDHMEAAGYQVEAIDRDADLHVVKDSLGLPADLSSCHTGVVDGYVVEGHVPAEQVDRLLAERPDVLGIAVPGMPIGSPGMEMGDRRDAYDVLVVDKSGEAGVYASIPGSGE